MKSGDMAGFTRREPWMHEREVKITGKPQLNQHALVAGYGGAKFGGLSHLERQRRLPMWKQSDSLESVLG